MHDIESFRRAGHQTVDWIAAYLANPGRFRVTPAIRPGGLIDRLPESGPETGVPLEQIAADFESTILPAVGHWNHPRFFNFFANTSSVPGIVGEMLSATLNTNGLNWVASPAVAELEKVTLGWLRQWMGLDASYFGQIFDTASISTLHALAAARQLADPASRHRGLTRQLRVYASTQAHSSIEKAVIAVGIGQDNLVKVPVDDAFRLDPAQLRALIQADRAAGYLPCAIVATVGTTSTTSVDPIAPIVAIAEEFGLWVHIDAAHAGAAMLLPEFQPLLAGQERAHSLVVNAHKWLQTPMDCSVFFTRFPEVLQQAFSLTPEYLRTSEDPRAINLMDYGIPLGRRFRALKLWFVFRNLGRQGLAAEIRRQIALADRLRAHIAADPRFVIAAPGFFSTVCFRLLGSEEDNRRLAAEINGGGEYFISQTRLHGELTLRVAIGNVMTAEADIDGLWEALTTRCAPAVEHSRG